MEEHLEKMGCHIISGSCSLALFSLKEGDALWPVGIGFQNFPQKSCHRSTKD